jgi:hypothetical protein
MIRRYLPKSVEELAQWYMRYVSPLSLIAGFLADNLFLTKRVDLFLTNALLSSYLVISALGIFCINLIKHGHWRHPWILRAYPLLPVVAQFAFGGLFSGYLSLYSRSASVSISWIFVVVLVVFIIGNERFAHFYERFFVQVSVYFIVLFSFLIFSLPVLFKVIGPWMFVASGVAALSLMAAFLALLFWLIPELRPSRRRTIVTVATIYVIFNALYFSNAIPPLPLALKDAGVYHSVTHLPDGTYRLLGEEVPWYEVFLRYNKTFHEGPSDRVYVYVSVFAPSGLSTQILHQWQYYDPTSNKWVTTDTISYSIVGGRDGGYEGYTYKGHLAPGAWRVNVMTQYGQLIGRVAFTVVEASTTPALTTIDR